MENTINKTERLPDKCLKAIYAPNPSTTRGSATIIKCHPKEQKIIYSSGKLVIIRNIYNINDTLVYKGHNEHVTAVCFSPNGYWVASGDKSGKIRIWSYDNPEHTLKLEILVFSGEINDIAWDSESKRIVAVGDGSGYYARVFTWDTGNSLGEIIGPQKRILSVDYRKKRPFRISTGSEDFNVCVFEGPPFKFKQNVNGVHNNFVNCVRYSPNGDYLLATSSDKSISLYDGNTGDFIDKFKIEHNGSIYSISWITDTKFITASADKTLKIWDLNNKKESLDTIYTSDKPDIKDMQVGVCCLPTGEIVSISLSGNINILDINVKPPKIKKTMQGHQVNILSIDIGHDGKIFTGSYDGISCEWIPTDSGYNTKVLKGDVHGGKICGITSNNKIIASIGWDDYLRIAMYISVEDISYTTAIKLDKQPNGIATPRSDTDIIFVSTADEIIIAYQNSIVHRNTVKYTSTCLAISPDGNILAVGSSNNNTIYIYEVDGNAFAVNLKHELKGHLGAPTCMSFNSESRYLAVGDSYREIRVWDIENMTCKIESQWVYHSIKVTCIDWSPNGLYIASGSLDGHIYIWDFKDPSNKQKLEFAHKEGVTGVKFLNNTILYSVGNDACLNKWEIQIQK